MEIQRQLTIDRIKDFQVNIEQLEWFLRNVQLSVSKRNGQKTFKYQSEAVQQSVKKYGIKVFKIWKQFISRLNDCQSGITYFHLQFIKVALKFYLYKQTIPIISQPGLPILINLLQYKQYLKLSGICFIQMRDYQKSCLILTRANQIQLGNLDQSILILQLLTLIKKIIGQEVSKENYSQSFEIIKQNHNNEVILNVQNQEKVKVMQFEMNMFYSICENQELNEKEIHCLKEKGLIQLYNKGKNTNIISLKQWIKTQLKSESLYRIKCNQMRNLHIGKFPVIKQINNPQSLYKFDQKNQIMYFNHKFGTQQQIDRLLNRTLQMQRILKNTKNSKYQSAYEISIGRFMRKG